MLPEEWARTAALRVIQQEALTLLPLLPLLVAVLVAVLAAVLPVPRPAGAQRCL